MPAATQPIYSRLGDVSSNGTTGMNAAVLTAAADYTGVSANYALVWTADATNGGYIQRVQLKPIGTNVASVMRFFINNASTPGTATNNTFFDEISLPATTISAVAALVTLSMPFGFALNPGFRIYGGLGTTVAAGWTMCAIGGKY